MTCGSPGPCTVASRPRSWDHISTPFLRYWLHRATLCYLEDTIHPTLKKDGTRTAANLAQIDIATQIIPAIHRELRNRGEA